MGLAVHFAVALALIILVVTAGLVRFLRRPRRKTYAVAIARGDPTDPADLGLTAAAVTFRLSDRAESPGWVIDGQADDGPTVIVIHGFADSRYGALTWVDLFVAFASRIVVFDLPGHGESTSPRSHQGVREVDDVLAVMRQLESTGPVVLFGYSFGATVAITAAARDESGRIVGVIADGPYRFWSRPIVATMRMKRYPAQPFVALAWLWFRLTEPGFRSFDRCEDAARLGCPLLVLHGTGDVVCPIDAGRAIAEAAPSGTLAAFDGAGHMGLVRRDPQRYRDQLARFFAGLKS